MILSLFQFSFFAFFFPLFYQLLLAHFMHHCRTANWRFTGYTCSSSLHFAALVRVGVGLSREIRGTTRLVCRAEDWEHIEPFTMYIIRLSESTYL
jgi:hypothetical protein